MANIYRRGKAWYGRVQHKGVEYRESLKTTSRTVAQKRLREWLERLNELDWSGKPRKTYDEAAVQFMDHHMPQLKEGSRVRYMTSLKKLTPAFEGLYLDQITGERLSEFERQRRGEGAANPSIRRDLACLSSIFSCAVEWEWCDGNPIAIYLKRRAKRGLRESPPRTRYLSYDEESALLAASATYLHNAIVFAIETGLRLEEQLSLEHSQVDLKRREIVLTRTKNDRPRRVPLTDKAAQILAQMPRHIHSPYVFHKKDGSRYGRLTRGLSGAARRAGVKNLRWHDLRRTCGCRLLQDRGFKMEEVRDWLGHQSVVQTERAYAFLGENQLRARLDAGTKTGTGHTD